MEMELRDRIDRLVVVLRGTARILSDMADGEQTLDDETRDALRTLSVALNLAALENGNESQNHG